MACTSSELVAQSTDPKVNETIRRKIEQRIAYYANHPEQIDRRLAELDREWDVERCLGVTSAGLTLYGLLMAFVRGRRFLFLPIAVQSFYLQHKLQGWCPPLPLLRRLGVRTEAEIAAERLALEALQEASGEIEERIETAAAAGTVGAM
jgi:hypothetical protein